MSSKKEKTVSFFAFVASIVTIFTFVTGIYSLPAIFSNISPPKIAGFDIKTISYGILIISQAVFFFSYFIACRFFYNKLILDVLKLYSGVVGAYLVFVFTAFGLGLSFIMAEGFWGPLSHWEFKNGPNIQVIFLLISLLIHAVTAQAAVE